MSDPDAYLKLLTPAVRAKIKSDVMGRMNRKEFMDLTAKCIEKHGGKVGEDDFYYDLFMMMASQEHKGMTLPLFNENRLLKAENRRLSIEKVKVERELLEANEKLEHVRPFHLCNIQVFFLNTICSFLYFIYFLYFLFIFSIDVLCLEVFFEIRQQKNNEYINSRKINIS